MTNDHRLRLFIKIHVDGIAGFLFVGYINIVEFFSVGDINGIDEIPQQYGKFCRAAVMQLKRLHDWPAFLRHGGCGHIGILWHIVFCEKFRDCSTKLAFIVPISRGAR